MSKKGALLSSSCFPQRTLKDEAAATTLLWNQDPGRKKSRKEQKCAESLAGLKAEGSGRWGIQGEQSAKRFPEPSFLPKNDLLGKVNNVLLFL